MEDLLAGVKLLLVTPNPDGESDETSLANIRGKLDRAAPVLTLSTTLGEAPVDHPGFILWPCRLEDRTEKIEIALFPAPEA